jgi:hypothetical protein
MKIIRENAKKVLRKSQEMVIFRRHPITTMKTIYGEKISQVISKWDNVWICVVNGRTEHVHVTKIINK